ncbi:hypothetical protein D9611_014673 [Ephemerocybe angulata]|uniref:Uncharacterized protein n=1 Tax=Ephemerocybe angulata TaxID=980116 RepID=A0A8H5B7L3_9AGAR|nr:hypothetical protein D9611_014673 [Tulosesus angulatus]
MPEHTTSRSPERRRDRDDRDDRGDRERRGEQSAGPSSHRHHHHKGRSRSRSRDRDRRPRSRSRSPGPGRDNHRRPSRSRSRSRSKERRERRKARSRSHSQERRSEKKKRARSPSSSSDSSDSHSRRKRDKKKERKREKKRGKKEKKDKKKSSGSSSHWGKYGIISDVDIFSKTAEFHAWLVEERKINPETITKDLQRKEFSRFVEDFNTATLPNEKYYNMEVYERRMNALRQGEYLPPTDDLYDFEADLKAIKSSHKKKTEEPETYLSREQLMDLRKVQQERAEISRMKLLGMDIKQSHGVRMDGSAFDD